MRYALAAVLCLSSLFAQDKPKSALDKPTLEAYLRHMMAIIPEVEVKIDDPKPTAIPTLLQVDVHLSYSGQSKNDTYYVTKDGKQILSGSIYEIAKSPFQEDIDRLKTDKAPSFGAANAQVTLVEFGDFQCPNCKGEAQAIRENLLKVFPTQAKIYFKDFPLESIHPWAKPAAITGRCFLQQSQGAFWQYHDWVYEHQEEITPESFKDKVMDFAKTASGVDSLQLGRCIDTKATEAEVDASIAEGRALHVEATPTLFVNGRRLVGAYPWPNLEQLINGELNYQKTQASAPKKADDSCCEIKIPSALNK